MNDQKLVVIKSPAYDDASIRALQAAIEHTADIVLIHEGAALARKGELDGFCGTAYVVEGALQATGLRDGEAEPGIGRLSLAGFLALVRGAEEVSGVY